MAGCMATLTVRAALTAAEVNIKETKDALKNVENISEEHKRQGEVGWGEFWLKTLLLKTLLVNPQKDRHL